MTAPQELPAVQLLADNLQHVAGLFSQNTGSENIGENITLRGGTTDTDYGVCISYKKKRLWCLRSRGLLGLH